MKLLLSLLSFTFVIFYLFLSIFALFRGWKNRANQIFAVFSLLLAAWALGYTFIFSAADMAEVLSWYRFSAVGWNLASAAGFHLWFVLTRKRPRKFHILLPVLFYIPGMIFLSLSLSGALYAYGFIPASYGWKELVNSSDPWVIAYNLFQLSFAVTGIVMLLRWLRQNRNSVKIRIQTVIMIVTILISTVLTFLSNYFSSALGWDIPPLGHIFFGVWAFGIWISIIRYRLMNLTPEIVTDEITSKMMDILILVDPQGNVLKTNPRAEELLGYTQKDLIGKQFSPLVHEKDQFFRLILKIREQYIPFTNELHLVSRKHELIPVSLYATVVKDNLGDNAGFVIVAHDIREMKALKKEVAERKKAQDELKNTYAELETEKNKLKIRNEIYEHELSLARAIQMQFIPKASPSPDIAFYYHPMEEVGGDFFDMVRYPDGGIGIFLSDVSGHGVPAALITSMIKSVTLQFSMELSDPAEFLYLMNDFLYGFTGGNFITAFYGIYRPEQKEFIYANAGHLPPLLIRKDSVTAIGEDKKGVPLGVLSSREIKEGDRKYINQKLAVEEGSKLVFCTDGLTETVSIRDNRTNPEEFGTAYLNSVLIELFPMPVPIFIERLVQRLMDFRNSDRFDDDICMICLDIPLKKRAGK
ncbi:MAG: hypothetical protein A2Y33_03635 [Spirochaetes bacterium GWF1_51_8]|nr:MAG: hypothetical protein A2Y33_03635 [Spirochaetes bacterium GWF1_51_8]